MPFFSVIIPLYNKEHLIEQTIKSVLNQTFSDFEVVVVNDGSTDNSIEVLTQLIDDRFKVINQNNLGVSNARNIGISASKGKYIALLDADDYWYNNHLTELKKQIDLFPGAGLYCNNHEINYNQNLIKPATFNFTYGRTPIIVEDYFKSSIINSVAWTSAVAFEKNKFNSIGKFNEDLLTGQDIDLWIRFALNYKIAFNPAITMRYHNFESNNLSKSNFNNNRYSFINSYKNEEKSNRSLKLYLDINRYATALRCKINGEYELYKRLRFEIDFSNLNFKQKLLLNCPIPFLKLAKNTQKLLIKNKIYLSAHK